MTGVSLFMTMGMALEGSLPEITLKLSRKRYSMIAAKSNDGVEDIYIQERNVNGAVFLDFIRRCLIPVLMPFNGHNPKSIVIVDNASVHKGARVQELINEVGALI